MSFQDWLNERMINHLLARKKRLKFLIERHLKEHADVKKKLTERWSRVNIYTINKGGKRR